MRSSTGRDRVVQGLESRFRTLITVVASAASAIGILVVAGWVLGIEALVRLRPDYNVMKFNTALCLIASGCGLFFLLHPQSRWKTLAARAAGLFVLVIGSMTLLETFLGWNLHIDQLFFYDMRWHLDLHRMVTQTATFFVFAGVFILSSSSRRRAIARWGPVFALLANLAAQEAVLDLIFRANKTEGPAGHTAAALFTLSIGMILLPNRHGWLAPMTSRSAGGKTMRWLVPAATFVPPVAGWMYLEVIQHGAMTPTSGIVAMVLFSSAALLLITIWTANSIDNVDLRLAAIIDSSDDAIFSKSLDSLILTWNHGAELLYGFTAEEAIGNSVLMLIPPEFHDEQRAFLEQVRHGNSVIHHETARMRKDGSRIYVSITLSPLRNASGIISGYSVITRDITERKRAEKAVNESEKAFRTLAELVPQLIWKCTPDGLSVYFNQRWADYTGLTLEESYGRGWNTPFHPDDKQPAWYAWNHAVETGEDYRIDCRLRAANGDYRWFLIKGVPQQDAEGSVQEWFGTCTDIDDLKRAEAQIRELNSSLELRVEERTVQLQESQRQVQRKLDNILSPQGDITNLELHDVLDVEAVRPLMQELWKLTGIPIFILDLHGTVLLELGWQDVCTRFHRVHPASCQNCIESDSQLTTGVPSGEFRLYKCKNNLWDVVTPIMLGKRHIGNLFSGQFLFDDDVVDSGLFSAQARKYGFDEQEYLAALGRVPRISRTTMQAAMEMYSQLAGMLSRQGYGSVKLARAMAESTRTNAELLHTSKELEGFAYSVSHDLRAPLRHMDGFLTLLSKRSYASLDERGKHYIDSTLEASQRMGRLIDDLLQFSRLGRAGMRKGPVNLNQLIDDTRMELEPESRGRNVVWHVDPLPLVSGDQPMLRQVLGNLIGNALKFTRKREQAVISVGTRSEKNGRLVFFVQDNGVGFDMRYYEKLFQVFQRLHSEDEFDGTGIGLANVRRIVERHGGEVWAEGEVDKGATFYFSLPSDDTQNGESYEPVEAHLAG